MSGVTERVREFINSFLGTDSTEIKNNVDAVSVAKQVRIERYNSATGQWVVCAFSHAGQKFVQVQQPDGKIYYEVPLKMAESRNASGAHRDKKREMKNGEGKYKEKLTFKEYLMVEAPMKGSDPVDEHPYSVKILYKGKGHWPKLKGEIYEHDVLIGTFSRAAVQDGYIPPIEYKFRTERSKARFDDFADSLSIEETIEALLPNNVLGHV